MRILPIFIPHAGCQHACVFCDQKRVSLQQQVPPPAAVKQMVADALRHGPLDEVAYYGGSFTALPHVTQRSYLAALQPYLADRRVGGIRLSTRPDAISGEIIELLRSFGVTTVELGCQSFSDSVLQASRRGHDAAGSVASARLLRQHGFRLGIQLMPGLPGSDRGEVISSLEAALALGPDFLRIYPVIVLAGTRLARLWQQDEFEPLALESAVELCVDMELLCQERRVPVIRYGLQANSALDAHGVLAGPYHPAFGQLVKSRLWRRALMRLHPDRVADIRVNPAEFSDAIGHGRENFHYMRTRHGNFNINRAPEVLRGFISSGDEVCCLTQLAAGKGHQT